MDQIVIYNRDDFELTISEMDGAWHIQANAPSMGTAATLADRAKLDAAISLAAGLYHSADQQEVDEVLSEAEPLLFAGVFRGEVLGLWNAWKSSWGGALHRLVVDIKVPELVPLPWELLTLPWELASAMKDSQAAHSALAKLSLFFDRQQEDGLPGPEIATVMRRPGGEPGVSQAGRRASSAAPLQLPISIVQMDLAGAAHGPHGPNVRRILEGVFREYRDELGDVFSVRHVESAGREGFAEALSGRVDILHVTNARASAPQTLSTMSGSHLHAQPAPDGSTTSEWNAGAGGSGSDGGITAEDLLGLLVASGTRLLVLQVDDGDFESFEWCLRIAGEVAAAGPAVLVSVAPDAGVDTRFFQGFYAALVHDRPLDRARSLADSLGWTVLICRPGGEDVLRFSILLSEAYGLRDELVDQQARIAALVEEELAFSPENADLADLRDKLEATRTQLLTLEGEWEFFSDHESKSCVPLARNIARLSRIRDALGGITGSRFWLSRALKAIEGRAAPAEEPRAAGFGVPPPEVDLVGSPFGGAVTVGAAGGGSGYGEGSDGGGGGGAGASESGTAGEVSGGPTTGAENQEVAYRYPNFEFHYDDGIRDDELGVSEGLLSEGKYRVELNIGSKLDVRYGGAEQQAAIQRPAHTEEETITLDISAFSNDAAISVTCPASKLVWPATGPSPVPAVIRLRVEKVSSDCEGILLDFYFYYQGNLLYTARFSIDVRAQMPDAWPQDERPIEWVNKEGPDYRSYWLSSFGTLRNKAPRAVNLAIQRGAQDNEYFCTAFLTGSELVPARIVITQDVLASYMVRSRGALDDLRYDPVYLSDGYDARGEYVGNYLAPGGFQRDTTPSDPAKANDVYTRFLEKMAEIGYGLWTALCAEDSAANLFETIRTTLHPGDTIQVWIDDRATDFVVPWVWLYPEKYDGSQQVDRTKFWGYQYVIEQLLQVQLQCPPIVPFPPSELSIEGGLSMSVGVYNLEQTPCLESVLGNRSRESGGVLKVDFFDSPDTWGNSAPGNQLLYFFSHGHTQKPVGLEASMFFYAMADKWVKWLDQDEAETSGENACVEKYRNQLRQTLGDLQVAASELQGTYIELAHGKLLLRNLGAIDPLQKRPLVFLNMCESAQVFPDTTGGLIDLFLRKGASAVIGTEIPMPPWIADWLGERFLFAFFDGQPNGTGRTVAQVGRLLLDLRKESLDIGNPFAFAYTLFGDATLRLSGLVPPSHA